MKPEQKDYVHRRIVVEFGQLYAYVYITDGSGKLIDEEPFKQPYRIERAEAAEDAKETYDLVWQHLSDTVVATPLQEGDDDAAESEGPEEDD